MKKLCIAYCDDEDIQLCYMDTLIKQWSEENKISYCFFKCVQLLYTQIEISYFSSVPLSLNILLTGLLINLQISLARYIDGENTAYLYSGYLLIYSDIIIFFPVPQGN